MQMSARPRVPDAQLTELTGGPCVLVNRRCRQATPPPTPDSAVVGEADGNLTAGKDDAVIAVDWQSSFAVRTSRRKGRLMPTVVTTHLTDTSREETVTRPTTTTRGACAEGLLALRKSRGYIRRVLVGSGRARRCASARRRPPAMRRNTGWAPSEGLAGRSKGHLPT
jgi:hypothetical protein